MRPSVPPLTLGLEVCARQGLSQLAGARFGLLMNRASVDVDGNFACDVLQQAFPNQLVALFTPQHGMWGDVQANMIETPHGQHARLDLPIYSLYSATRRPDPSMLQELDWLVVDLPDVGTRVYTYVWTLLECMRACAEANVGVIVLDRPNPIGGCLVEGRLLETAYRSFVGGAEIPMRHGLTLGELAVLLRREQKLDLELCLVPVVGWEREKMFPATGRVWIPPSPNLPTFEATVTYPGQVLLEGTNLSEGRGTTTPFLACGAPYVDADLLCDRMTGWQLPGVRFLPIHFRPTFDKWSGDVCQGVYQCVTDANAYRPYRTTLALLASVRAEWPDQFAWTPPPYEYESVRLPIDILSGSARLREIVDSEKTLQTDNLRLLHETDASWYHRMQTAVDEAARLATR